MKPTHIPITPKGIDRNIVSKPKDLLYSSNFKTTSVLPIILRILSCKELNGCQIKAKHNS